MLGYSLALVITTILVSGLLVTGSGFVDTQTERVIRSELTVIGQDLASDVEATDRLSRASGSDVEVAVRSDLPSNVAGRSYSLSVNATGNDELVLSTTDPSVSVTVPVETVRPLAPANASGGSVRTVLAGGELEVRSG